ncbi:hypothetical protein VPMS16_642 [Vibrio sp. 16]|nr:hypothetical protein VPMS16_642 [Vibrio sp. 16]
MVNNCLADVFVVESVIYIIGEAEIVGGVMDFCVYNNILLLCFLFFVETYEGS